MTEVEVTYDPNVVDELAIARRLYARFVGFWRSRAETLAVFCAAVLAGLAIARLSGSTDWLADLIASIYTVIGGLIGIFAVTRLRTQRLRRALLAHPVRSEPRVNVLSQSGAKRGPHLFAWSDVAEVTTLPGMTLLLLSPLDFIALPDASLPPGLTPEALRAQIALWRAAPAP
jgi:hypothetical protein